MTFNANFSLVIFLLVCFALCISLCLWVLVGFPLVIVGWDTRIRKGIPVLRGRKLFFAVLCFAL